MARESDGRMEGNPVRFGIPGAHSIQRVPGVERGAGGSLLRSGHFEAVRWVVRISTRNECPLDSREWPASRTATRDISEQVQERQHEPRVVGRTLVWPRKPVRAIVAQVGPGLRAQHGINMVPRSPPK